jgi:hypothetical protein
VYRRGYYFLLSVGRKDTLLGALVKTTWAGGAMGKEKGTGHHIEWEKMRGCSMGFVACR